MAKHLAPPVDPGTPTQVAHPWRATARTVFQAALAFAAMWGTFVEAAGLDPSIPWVAASLALTGVITRIMATNKVDKWLGGSWLGSGVGAEVHEPEDVEHTGEVYPHDEDLLGQ